MGQAGTAKAAPGAALQLVFGYAIGQVRGVQRQLMPAAPAGHDSMGDAGTEDRI